MNFVVYRGSAIHNACAHVFPGKRKLDGGCTDAVVGPACELDGPGRCTRLRSVSSGRKSEWIRVRACECIYRGLTPEAEW